MARPVIVTTQSVLGFLQHLSVSFQPYALNNPTSWSSSPLPAGMTLNAATGLISGAATKPGVYNVALIANNADGASEPVVFTIGIEASVADPTANVIDLEIDLGTRVVSGRGDKALFTGKYKDDLIFRVQIKRGGVPATITLTALKGAIKKLDTEKVLASSTAFSSVGNGVFLVHLPLIGDPLKSALSEEEEEKGTLFEALCEFEWEAENTLGVGPTTLRGASQTFPGLIVRNLNP